MPAPTNNTVQETTSTFLGLQPYTEANSNSFFGRDKEIDATTTLIQLNTLTIVFGRSGTGKTSLLNAGVFPKLRKNYCLPFRIRLEFDQNSPDLVTQVKNVLRKKIDEYGFNVQTYPGEETLWEYFHKELLWVSITPILVFDQFEEIFTLAKTDPRWANEMPVFWEELSDLIENNIPKKLEYQFLNHRDQIAYNYKTQRTKIVFAFREEYLPEFETITSKIPSLKYSRFRLLPMSGNQAFEVITKTWKENINPSEARQIVSYFTNDQALENYDLITVEPSLLSQVCAYIDRERIGSGGGKVSAELLNRYPKVAILRSIYEEAVTEANSSLNRKENDNRNVIKEFVEDRLITNEGYRTKYHLGAGDEMLWPGINVLSAKYFVREDDNVVELTHDVVAPIIKADREKRRKEIALASARKKARKRMLVILLATILVAGGLWALAITQTKEAIQDRDDAERDKATAERGKKVADSLAVISRAEKVYTDQIIAYKKDSLRKAFINELKNKDSSAAMIDRLNKEIALLKDSLAKRSSAEIPVDSSEVTKLVAKLNEQIEILKADTTKKSMSLRQKDDRLSAIDIEKIQLKNELAVKNKELEQLVSDHKKNLNADAQKYKIEIADLKQQIGQLNSRIDDLNREIDRYKLLRHENDSLIKEIRRTRKTIDSLMKLIGNANLIGKLYYQNDGNSQVKPSNIPVYLIAKAKNRQLVRDISVYEINCYEKELNAAEASFKTVTDANGNYAFRNIPEGEYLLKICTYYGGFYTVRITDPKKRVEKNFNASPPVLFTYSN